MESQTNQRRRLDDEFAGLDTVLGAERRSGQHYNTDRAEDVSHGQPDLSVLPGAYGHSTLSPTLLFGKEATGA